VTAIKTCRAIVSAFIILSILCGISNAAPSIDSWTNSITLDSDIYPVVDHAQSINFNATSDEGITTWTWYVDGTDQSHNFDNLSASFTSPFNHNVSVMGANANGSTQMITWYPVVHRELSTTPVELLNESGYDRVLASFEGDTDFEEFLSASTVPYTLILGRLFFLIIYGIYFVMLWIRQEKSIVPIVLAFSIGGLLIGFISEDFAGTAVLFIIIGAMGVLYSIYRER
jgi:hypothetical protein